MVRAYIGVGSNLGDRRANVEKAAQQIAKLPRTRLLRTSPLYETEPIGGPPQGKYINGVFEIETELEPDELLNALLSIEKTLKRKRKERFGPRTIDLDILLYGTFVLESQTLRIPHPRMCERWFVIKPLSDLSPNLVHPTTGRTIKSLLEDFKEQPAYQGSMRIGSNPANADRVVAL